MDRPLIVARNFREADWYAKNELGLGPHQWIFVSTNDRSSGYTLLGRGPDTDVHYTQWWQEGRYAERVRAEVEILAARRPKGYGEPGHLGVEEVECHGHTDPDIYLWLTMQGECPGCGAVV